MGPPSASARRGIELAQSRPRSCARETAAVSPAPARCACASPGPAAFYCVYYYYYIINTVTAAAARLPRARVCRCARRSYGTPRQPDRQTDGRTDGRTARVGPVSGPQPLTSPVAPPTVFDATTTAALPAATLHTAGPRRRPAHAENTFAYPESGTPTDSNHGARFDNISYRRRVNVGGFFFFSRTIFLETIFRRHVPRRPRI